MGDLRFLWLRSVDRWMVTDAHVYTITWCLGLYEHLGSIPAALLCLVYPPREEERGLLSRTAAGNRAYEH